MIEEEFKKHEKFFKKQITESEAYLAYTTGKLMGLLFEIREGSLDPVDSIEPLKEALKNVDSAEGGIRLTTRYLEDFLENPDHERYQK